MTVQSSSGPLSLDSCKAVLEKIEVGGDSPSSSGRIDKSYLNFIETLSALTGPIPQSLLTLLETHKGDTEKCKRIQRIVKVFCEKIVQIFQEPGCVPENILVGLLRAVSFISALFREYPVLRKQLAKSIILIWSTWPSEAVRVVALFALHHLCKRYSKIFEVSLKEMYQHYGKACRSLSTHNIGQATLMLNGLVEIFALYPEKSVAFGTRCLRQMASLVQQATKKSDKSHVKKVLCWQFISLVRFWAHLMATQLDKAPEGALKALLFPICNLLTCLLSFQVSPRFFGFHFHIIASALEMTEYLGCHIPVTSCLLKIVGYVAKQPLYKLEVKKAAYDLVALYKVPKSETLTKGYLECVADESLFYILKLLTKQTSQVTFPEQANAVLSSLKNVIKNFPKLDRNLKKQIEGHMSKVAQQKKEVESLRNSEAVTPAAIAFGKVSLVIPESKQPLLVYVANLEKVRNIKRKLLADKSEEGDDLTVNVPVVKKSDSDSKLSKRSRQELPATKKRKKPDDDAAPNKSKKSKKAIGNAANEEDIIEDFVIDD